MGGKRLEVSAGTETSYDLVPGFGEPAAATAFNAPRGKRNIDYATTPRAHYEQLHGSF
jgi:hypothetical protein